MVPLSLRLSTAALVHALLATALLAQVAGTIEQEADYSGELPRIAPRSVEEALRAFIPLEGFHVEPVAAEPLVADPVAVSFDGDGRAWVVCMRGYSERADEHLGEVRVLEDIDGDGVYDRATVFLDGLSWPTGIHCWAGGAFIAVAPDILWCKDTDGDGRADERRVVLSGFGRSNVQGLLNSLRWGLDNRIHGATSSSGGQATPAESGETLELRGRDFALDPRTGAVAATSGGAQHGLSFDGEGGKFVCSNSRHLEYVYFDERYLRRNPFLATPTPRVLIAADGGQAEVFRRSPVEPWRIVRTRLRVAGVVPGPVEGGGRAAGYFTGSTGVTVYRGDAWREEFRGQAFIGDVGSNIVHRKQLVPDGVGYRGLRADAGREFLASQDVWFRPVQFANAPDGCLWVIDMTREVIEHPASLPPVIKKHLDLDSGRDRGRLWRIAPAGFRPPRPPRLESASTQELVATLAHPNGWHRDTAARLLYERQDRAAIEPLRRMIRAEGAVHGRLHALWALAGLDALTAAVLVKGLGDPVPVIRRHALRLSEPLLDREVTLRDAVLRCAEDLDLRVRYQAAATLGETVDPRRLDALARVAEQDAGDTWVRVAIASSLARDAGLFIARLAPRLEHDSEADAGLRELLGTLAETVGVSGRRDEIAEVLRSVDSIATGNPSLAEGLLARLGRGLEKSGGGLREVIGGTKRFTAILAELITRAREEAADRTVPPDERAAAVRTLALGSFERDGERLRSLLDGREPQSVQLAALETLARYDVPEVATTILDAWDGFTPRVRTRAVEVLCGRTSHLAALLAALEDGTLRPLDLGAARRAWLLEHPITRVRERARRILESPHSQADKVELIARYRRALAASGDVERGRAIFGRVCSGCHAAGGVGTEIGPSLAAMATRGADAVLLSILDPNREVDPRYLTYVAVGRDGTTRTGAITAETATTITLQRDAGDTDTVLRLEIVALRSTGRSLMPEGLEAEIDPDAMADLLAFLLAATHGG